MNSAENTIAQIIAGAFVTVISLFVISSSTQKSDKQNLTTKMNQPLMEDEEGAGKEELEPINGQSVDGEALNTFPISTASIYFQILLILSSCYYAMLLTNWGNPTVFSASSIPYYSANDQSFWVKLSVQWISTALYLFSMVAPVIFPDREFWVKNNYIHINDS